MTKMKEVHVIYVTTYGDDWESTERHVVTSMEEAKHFQSEKFKKDELKISGVEGVSVEVELNASISLLKDRLTVDEFCELFPEVKTLIDNYFKGE